MNINHDELPSTEICLEYVRCKKVSQMESILYVSRQFKNGVVRGEIIHYTLGYRGIEWPSHACSKPTIYYLGGILAGDEKNRRLLRNINIMNHKSNFQFLIFNFLGKQKWSVELMLSCVEKVKKRDYCMQYIDDYEIAALVCSSPYFRMLNWRYKD